MGQEFAPVGPSRTNDQNFLTGFVGVNSTNIVREKMVNNRLLYGRYTPFMEIMSVHPRDKSTEVARKMQSIMFGIPHLSFFVSTLPEDTKQTIRFWLNYWRENQHVLMESEFEPENVANYYPIIKVQDTKKTIYTVYGDYSLSLPSSISHPVDVINSKASLTLDFFVAQGTVYNYEIFNHMGERVEKASRKSKHKNTLEFSVPEGGFIRFIPD